MGAGSGRGQVCWWKEQPMANKCMEEILISLAIRELQIMTPLRFPAQPSQNNHYQENKQEMQIKKERTRHAHTLLLEL